MQFLALRDVKVFEALKPDKWKIRSLPEEGVGELENGESILMLVHSKVSERGTNSAGCFAALDEATGSGLDLILMPGEFILTLRPYQMLTSEFECIQQASLSTSN